MTPPTETVAEAVARERRQVATDLCALAKPRVVLMVLVTTMVGFYVGSTGALDLSRLLHLLLGTALAAGGTLALNQYLERDVDARMLRTRTRPLPDGRLQPPEALGFGALVGVAGLAYLAVAVGGLAALVTAATAVLYLFAYTPLKLRTPFCMIVGAVPGALPAAPTSRAPWCSASCSSPAARPRRWHRRRPRRGVSCSHPCSTCRRCSRCWHSTSHDPHRPRARAPGAEPSRGPPPPPRDGGPRDRHALGGSPVVTR